MIIEHHTCDIPMATGTHKRGSGSASLVNPGKNFKSCGIRIGMPIFNLTQVTDGLVTAVTEDSVTDDTNTWDTDDEYEIYAQEKDSAVSSIVIDKRYGRKTNPKLMIDEELRPEDRDLDEDGEDVFGPNQPSRSHK